MLLVRRQLLVQTEAVEGRLWQQQEQRQVQQQVQLQQQRQQDWLAAGELEAQQVPTSPL